MSNEMQNTENVDSRLHAICHSPLDPLTITVRVLLRTSLPFPIGACSLNPLHRAVPRFGLHIVGSESLLTVGDLGNGSSGASSHLRPFRFGELHPLQDSSHSMIDA